MARQDPFEAGVASRNWERSERTDLGGTAGPSSTTAELGGRLSEVAGRLECAVEEWEAAHRACLDVDEDFAHELAQIQFAMGCVRLSWCKKHKL